MTFSEFIKTITHSLNRREFNSNFEKFLRIPEHYVFHIENEYTYLCLNNLHIKMTKVTSVHKDVYQEFCLQYPNHEKSESIKKEVCRIDDINFYFMNDKLLSILLLL